MTIGTSHDGNPVLG